MTSWFNNVYLPREEAWALRRLAYLGYVDYGDPEGQPADEMMHKLNSKGMVKPIKYSSGHDGYEITEKGISVVLELGGGIASDWNDSTDVNYPMSLEHLRRSNG
jgi:hypothetical protein